MVVAGTFRANRRRQRGGIAAEFTQQIAVEIGVAAVDALIEYRHANALPV
jgi:hypothetical protein